MDREEPVVMLLRNERPLPCSVELNADLFTTDLLSPCGNMWLYAIASLAGPPGGTIEIEHLRCTVGHLLSRAAASMILDVSRTVGVNYRGNSTTTTAQPADLDFFLTLKVQFVRLTRAGSARSAFQFLQAHREVHGNFVKVDWTDFYDGEFTGLCLRRGANMVALAEMSCRPNTTIFPEWPPGVSLQGMGLGTCRTLDNDLRVGGWRMYQNVCSNFGQDSGSVYVQSSVKGKWWSWPAQGSATRGWVLRAGSQRSYVRSGEHVRTVRYWNQVPVNELYQGRHNGTPFFGTPAGVLSVLPTVLYGDSSSLPIDAAVAPLEFLPHIRSNFPVVHNGPRRWLPTCTPMPWTVLVALFEMSFALSDNVPKQNSWTYISTGVLLLLSQLVCFLWACHETGVGHDWYLPGGPLIWRLKWAGDKGFLAMSFAVLCYIIGLSMHSWEVVTSAPESWAGLGRLHVIAGFAMFMTGAYIIDAVVKGASVMGPGKDKTLCLTRGTTYAEVAYTMNCIPIMGHGWYVAVAGFICRGIVLMGAASGIYTTSTTIAESEVAPIVALSKLGLWGVVKMLGPVAFKGIEGVVVIDEGPHPSLAVRTGDAGVIAENAPRGLSFRAFGNVLVAHVYGSLRTRSTIRGIYDPPEVPEMYSNCVKRSCSRNYTNTRAGFITVQAGDTEVPVLSSMSMHGEYQMSAFETVPWIPLDAVFRDEVPVKVTDDDVLKMRTVSEKEGLVSSGISTTRFISNVL